MYPLYYHTYREAWDVHQSQFYLSTFLSFLSSCHQWKWRSLRIYFFTLTIFPLFLSLWNSDKAGPCLLPHHENDGNTLQHGRAGRQRKPCSHRVVMSRTTAQIDLAFWSCHVEEVCSETHCSAETRRGPQLLWTLLLENFQPRHETCEWEAFRWPWPCHICLHP